MKIVVTGAAGFIGSNIVHGLNSLGVTDILAVDDLTDSRKFRNLLGADISEYIDHAEFYPRFAAGAFGAVDAVFHEGACSDTMEQDGRYMMATNYRCSVDLLLACQRQNVRLIYASSAAVYGGSKTFIEELQYENPLNVYGYSKLLFDNYVRKNYVNPQTQIVGFRYFNVYGPRESHKDRMASVAFHHVNQLNSTGSVKLFGENDGYSAGEQQRDFVYIDDIVRTNLWFLENADRSGIFNLGTGRAQSFNDVGVSIVNSIRRFAQLPSKPLQELVESKVIDYIPFPEALKGKYQSFTRADITGLRNAGYSATFLSVEEGVEAYLGWLQNTQS